MDTIWKLPLPVTDRTEVSIPASAEVIHVGEQYGELCLWARVDSGGTPTSQTFLIVGTGNPIPDGAGRHLGTAQVGPFVWHVFEAGGR